MSVKFQHIYKWRLQWFKSTHTHTNVFLSFKALQQQDAKANEVELLLKNKLLKTEDEKNKVRKSLGKGLYVCKPYYKQYKQANLL